MTDGGALPLWFSRTVAALAPRLVGTVTVGQAFGGDVEAVTLHSGLLAAAPRAAARRSRWSAQGPGQSRHRHDLGVLRASRAARPSTPRPRWAAVRWRCCGCAQADPRERHRGVSHHSRTAYGRVALATADVVVPASGAVARRAAARAGRHRLVEVVDGDRLVEVLRDSGLALSTMGRGLADDPVAFVAAAAAGRHAAALLAGSRRAPAAAD